MRMSKNVSISVTFSGTIRVRLAKLNVGNSMINVIVYIVF